jgi:hypothetical protein
MELRHRGTTGDDAGRVEDIRVTHEESNHILDRKPEGLASIEGASMARPARPSRSYGEIRKAFFSYDFASLSKREPSGYKLRSHSRARPKLIDSLGLKTSKQMAKSHAFSLWHVLRYLPCQRRFGPCPANTLELSRFSAY